jgi:long-subunit fatty acid transport protein
MIKKIISSICLLFAIASFAQDGTASPYSYYGIGEVKFSGTAENRAMGGLSILRDSIHLNIQNPASYSNLKLTSFAVGGNTNFTTISSINDEGKTRRTTLDYLAVGLPMGKLGLSFGLVPYSSIGYKTEIKITDATTNLSDIKAYTGSGEINKVYAGLGYNITKNLSIGANINYSFGKITANITEYKFISLVQYGTQEINLSNVKGMNVTLGLQFQKELKNKKLISSSLTYIPESNLNFSNSRTVYAGTDSQIIIIPNTTVILPSKLSFGVGYGHARKWQIGTEIVYQQNSKMSNRFNDITPNVSFENSTKYIFGGYYIPKYNSFTNYFERVVYRAGFNFENSGLVINGKAIKNQAISLGLGLPLGGTFSNINIGVELGKRGTTNSNLVQENYTNLIIGLSFSDKWFVKRKYD